ncbi:hypothetical protein DC522_28555 [Microvirga sp. KLBC 81]|uniref:hypothetical protein n=1 Tax=Microvirga sp. KLBC 81 TaxID=1862707 RepID=UPI000D51CABF|nr:hypothetical protein [Microvirga sp. KLBC 81]PVE21097.1 hypothetical protein DC522_28555 [Microvirga sp. KLBC 81]
MCKVATLAAISVLALGTISASNAEARDRNWVGPTVAAGVVGVAAGALLASAATPAYAYPAYAPVSYGYGGYYAAPAYRSHRVERVVRYYEEPRPVYRTRRVVRSYDYGYAPVSTRTVTYSYGSSYYGW